MTKYRKPATKKIQEYAIEPGKALSLAWCMAYALHLSRGSEEPENEVYWYTREKVFEYVQSIRGRTNMNWVTVLKEFDFTRNEFDLKILKERCNEFWLHFAQPELIAQQVHDS